MAEAALDANKKAEGHALEWLALAQTPGLGTTRGRRLAEFFGGIDAVFQASLTELEATGMQAASAQSLGTGRSMELAQDEWARAVAAGVTIVDCDGEAYPSQLKNIYDPPLVLYVRGDLQRFRSPVLLWLELGTPPLMEQGWPSASPVTWRRRASDF